MREVPLDTLRDPEKDEDRIKDDKWLVVLGVCTHLGESLLFSGPQVTFLSRNDVEWNMM